MQFLGYSKVATTSLEKQNKKAKQAAVLRRATQDPDMDEMLDEFD